MFLSEMKRSLSQVTFDQIVTALQSYKTSDSLEVLLSKMVVLTEDANTHGLFRGGIIYHVWCLSERQNLALGSVFHGQGRFQRTCFPSRDPCLSGMYQFVRPHHKKLFHEKCQQLTGRGCGFQPDHSLPKNKNQAAELNEGRKVCIPFSVGQTCFQFKSKTFLF